MDGHPAFRDREGRLVWPTWSPPVRDAAPPDAAPHPEDPRPYEDDEGIPHTDDCTEDVCYCEADDEPDLDYKVNTGIHVQSSDAPRRPRRGVPERGLDPPDRVRVAWAARGGALEQMLATLGCRPLRSDIRHSLVAYVRALHRDRRCDGRTRDLLREYLTGSE